MINKNKRENRIIKTSFAVKSIRPKVLYERVIPNSALNHDLLKPTNPQTFAKNINNIHIRGDISKNELKR